MSEANKAIVRRYFEEIWSKGNLNVADEIVGAAPGTTTGTPMSAERIKQIVSMFRAAFPDIKYNLTHMIAEGDNVMVHWTAPATHKGQFLSVAPTGRQITYQGFDLYRLANGRIVERWGINDDLGLLKQLGVSLPTR